MLAGAVETAVNVLWDAAPLVGDRVSVVGGGMIGACVARLLSGIPASTSCSSTMDRSKAALCGCLGVRYAAPDAAPYDRDLVIQTSGSGEGLRLALESAVFEGEMIEASWFGDRR